MSKKEKLEKTIQTKIHDGKIKKRLASSIEKIIKKIKKGRETEQRKEKSKKEIQTEIHDEEIENKKQIKTIRNWLFWILIAITILHLGLLYWFLNKSGNANLKFHGYFLSDKVLMTFLVTTTGDIAGLLVIITKFLFNAKLRENHSNDS